MEKTILNRRYEILRTIGQGGMAEVYLAHDILLDRNVAIKMLRDQFVADKALLEQFRREAKSAAKLVHPYITNIYDVVSEGDKEYIVMEYVEGVTLKEYLQKNKLSLNAVLEIGVRLADALQHAHSRHLIHCDIKPQNILIDKNLNPKIADFGIAKMVSNQTMVYTSTVMGSVHYLAPEQATGGQVTASSDVYSLGVVLFEMLTGKVPFDGNTAVAVAMMHAEKQVPPLSDYMDEVPEGLQEILNKALAKNPANRYLNAGALRRELQDLKMQLFPFSNEDYKKEMSEIDVEEFETNNNDDGKTIIMKRVDNTAKKEEEEVLEKDFTGDEEMAKKGRKKANRKFKWGINNIMIVTTILVVLASVAANFIFGSNRAVVVVPNVLKMTVVEAQNLLESKKFIVDLEEGYDDAAQPGTIIKQTPAAGEERKEGSKMLLVVNKGAELKSVPEVRTMTLEKAKRFIEHAGFEVGEVSRKFVRNEIIGVVLEQQPKGASKLPVGSKINLVINEGDKPVPNLVGKKVKDAEKLLKAAGLRLGEVRYIDDRPAKDTIVSTTPMAGQKVAEFEKVDLTVSNGEASKPKDIYVDFTVTVEKLVGFIDTDDKDKKKEEEKIKRKAQIYEDYYKKNKDRRYNIQVYVVDDRGRDLVFSGKKKIGENIRKKTEIVGNSRIKVYADGNLIEDKSL
jgi:serine/threonine-protein kinase